MRSFHGLLTVAAFFCNFDLGEITFIIAAVVDTFANIAADTFVFHIQSHSFLILVYRRLIKKYVPAEEPSFNAPMFFFSKAHKYFPAKSVDNPRGFLYT